MGVGVGAWTWGRARGRASAREIPDRHQRDRECDHRDRCGSGIAQRVLQRSPPGGTPDSPARRQSQWRRVGDGAREPAWPGRSLRPDRSRSWRCPSLTIRPIAATARDVADFTVPRLIPIAITVSSSDISKPYRQTSASRSRSGSRLTATKAASSPGRSAPMPRRTRVLPTAWRHVPALAPGLPLERVAAAIERRRADIGHRVGRVRSLPRRRPAKNASCTTSSAAARSPSVIGAILIMLTGARRRRGHLGRAVVLRRLAMAARRVSICVHYVHGENNTNG